MDAIRCCAECGYLAVRKRDSRELLDAEQEYREHALHGQVAQQIGFETEPPYEKFPICFVQAADLRKEILSRESLPSAAIILGVIRGKRDCSKATPWLQGFTPKEHKQMIDLEELHRQNRQHQWLMFWGMIAAIVCSGATSIGTIIAQIWLATRH